jgi:hypothetical protein
MGGGVGDWFKKAYNFGTRAYNTAKGALKKVGDVASAGEDIYNAVKSLSGNGFGRNTGDRGTRLFGSNPRPQKQLAFYQ